MPWRRRSSLCLLWLEDEEVPHQAEGAASEEVGKEHEKEVTG